MTDESAFIEVHNLHYHYTLAQPRFFFVGAAKETHSVLRDINFQLPQGSKVTLFGREAAGKTTLLRLLAGKLTPSTGYVLINGQKPPTVKHAPSGYVSPIATGSKETCHEILYSHARTQKIADPTSQVSNISDRLALSPFLHRGANQLSSTERFKLNLARAAICDTPLVLLDDITNYFSVSYISDLLSDVFSGRTVIIATRSAKAADRLELPVLLLHNGTLSHQGPIDKIALDTACPRIVDVWVEGLRYDILRKLRSQVGVLEARLIPSDQFAGQRLRVVLRSARYLPAMYDLVSQTALVQVEEIPPSLNDVIRRLAD